MFDFDELSFDDASVAPGGQADEVSERVISLDVDSPLSESDYVDSPNVLSAFDQAFSAQQNVLDHQSIIDRLVGARADVDTEMEKLRESIQHQLLELKQRKDHYAELLVDARRALRTAQTEYWSALRILQSAIDNLTKSKEFQSNSIHFDEITAGMPWREWALPHQLAGAKILATQKRAILADKMGLGKTLTSIIYSDMLQSQRVLVIAPAEVVNNFNRELKRWAPHRTVFPMARIPKAQREFATSLASQLESFVMTINYEAWRRDAKLIDSLVQLRFDTVILDEAHTIKNASGNAAVGVRNIVNTMNCCPRCSGEVISRKADSLNTWYDDCTSCRWSSNTDTDYDLRDRRSVKNVLPMTGTPIMNKPQDLYPLLNLVDDQVFDTERDFLRDYCQQDFHTSHWGFKSGGLERLAVDLGSKFLGRDRESAGVELPPQEIQVHDLDFDAEAYPNQWRIMEQLSKHAQIILESTGDKMTVLATIALITRQRQANVWPAGITIKDPETGEVVFTVGDEVNESMKLDKVMELINDYSDERVVVFSQFKGPLIELERRLSEAGISAARYDGDTSQSLRDILQTDFDRSHSNDPGWGRYQVVLCHYRSGGVGLNFTAATQTIILDEAWNPGSRDQAYGRTDRVGQTESSTVHVLRINKTVDTWLAALIEEKQAMVDGFKSETDLNSEYLAAFKNGEL